MSIFWNLTLLAALILVGWIGYRHFKHRRARKEKGPSAYIDGLNCLLAGDLENAYYRFKETVEKDIDNIDAYIKLGDILRKQGRLEKAIQIHQSLTARPSVSKKIEKEILRSLAQDYLASQKFARATSVLEELIRLDPQDLPAREMIIDLYEKEKRWEEAFLTDKEILKLKKIKDKNSLALYKTYIGIEQKKEGDLKSATETFKESISLDQNCVPAYLYLGDIYYENGKVESAISLWKKIVAKSPKFAFITYERLEKAYYEQGNFEEVLKIYHQFLKKHPHDLKTLLTLAKIYQKKDELPKATEFCKQALEYHSDSLEARVLLQELNFAEGNSEEAKKTFSLLWELIEEKNLFSCGHCGFKTKDFFWRCPHCLHWRDIGSRFPAAKKSVS
ncbi:MAG: tetratricopeptide repeat protein [Candidatus Edwardsbacteria bacterium]